MIIIIAAICLVIGFIFGCFCKYRAYRRNIGEAIVIQQIAKVAARPAHLINNVTLRTEVGTTQIDHIFIRSSGIYVIETKYYSGWIFGELHKHSWTQVIFRVKTKFKNPVFQNHGHILALRSLFNLPDDVFCNLVVFSGKAELKSDFGPDVIYASDIPAYFSQQTDDILDERKIAYIVGRIEMSRLTRSIETDEYHINSLISKLGRNAGS